MRVCVLIECGFHCSEFSLVHPWCCLGVGSGLFASCQLLHVLCVWAVGSGSLPFTCDSVDAEFN